MGSDREADYWRVYQWWHDESDAHFQEMARIDAHWLKPYFPADRSAPILDIGCGMGFAIAAFRAAGFTNVLGIDADAGQVERARKRKLPVEHVPVAETSGWMRARAGRFDLVTAIDLLEHVPVERQIEFLGDVFTLLRPGGIFVCRVPNANASAWGSIRHSDWTHRCSFTEYNLDFVLYTAGFREIAIVDPYPIRPLGLWRPQRWLLAFFRAFRRLEMIAEFGLRRGARVPLGLNIVASARRPLRP